MENNNVSKEGAQSAATRLDNLEKQVGNIGETLSKMVTLLEGQVKKKEEESEEDDEKVNPMPKDKKKEVPGGEVNADPEGGDVKLPQSTGEPDEKAKPVTDSVNFVQKHDFRKAVDAAVEAKFQDLLKSGAVTKSTTPRPMHETQKSPSVAKVPDLGMDLIQKSRTGKLDLASMNREVKDFAKSNYEASMKKVMSAMEVQ